tara:strand:- start:691 stop:1095 length:405 start_codon:yes stop_codon:yes gene_type:complete
MSMQAMASFMEKAQSDPKLGEDLVSLIDENEREEIYSKVVSLAGEHGFSVTVSDVKETRQQFEQLDASGEGDLNDNDLENVSGGVAPVVVAGLITGGAGVGAAGIGAGGAVTAAVISRGVNNTVNDVGNFFKKW